MKTSRWVVLAVLLLALGSFQISGLNAQESLIPITFQSKWFPQAQFAGYWAAGGHLPGAAASVSAPTEDGLNFYAQEGLDVTILDGGNVNPSENVAAGHADFGTDWIANMLRGVEDGLDLVHIAQIFQRPGFLFVAEGDSGIASVDDFAGRTVGVWDFGNEFPAEVCFESHGLTTDLHEGVPDPDVETVVYNFDPSLVFPGDVDVASAMIYNELDMITGMGFPLTDLNVISAANADCGLLEDFIFAPRELLDATNWRDTGLTGLEVAVRFVRASLKGWQWAIEHQAQAVDVVLDFCDDGCGGLGSTAAPDVHQAWQMARVAEMVQPALLADSALSRSLLGDPEAVTIGCLDHVQYERTLELLRDIDFIGPETGENVVSSEIVEALELDCGR